MSRDEDYAFLARVVTYLPDDRLVAQIAFFSGMEAPEIVKLLRAEQERREKESTYMMSSEEPLT